MNHIDDLPVLDLGSDLKNLFHLRGKMLSHPDHERYQKLLDNMAGAKERALEKAARKRARKALKLSSNYRRTRLGQIMARRHSPGCPAIYEGIVLAKLEWPEDMARMGL